MFANQEADGVLLPEVRTTACARAFRSSTSDFEELQVAGCELEAEIASQAVQSVGEIVQLSPQMLAPCSCSESDPEGVRFTEADFFLHFMLLHLLFPFFSYCSRPRVAFKNDSCDVRRV